MVSKSEPSGEKAAERAVPFIFRLNSSCRDRSDTIATLPASRNTTACH